MFNLLVSGQCGAWEKPAMSMMASRFKEYSGKNADTVVVEQPETLQVLEAIPTLLMYEVGTDGPNARIVRHGRLKGIDSDGSSISFTFEPDGARAYLNRGVLLEFADALGMHSFERHRTHWAIKDGDVPEHVLAVATQRLPERTVGLVAAEYVEAVRERNAAETASLELELKAFPSSVEKALSLVPSHMFQRSTPELYPFLDLKAGTPAARKAVDAILKRDTEEVDDRRSWAYSIAWFLAKYGSPTEKACLERAVDECQANLMALAGDQDALEALTEALWRCARSSFLVGRLQREVAVLTDRLVREQAPGGRWWFGRRSDGVSASSARVTAMATVTLQRLSDDKHHGIIRESVAWLLEQRSPDGVWCKCSGDTTPDVIATTLTLEAIRRSDLAPSLSHVLAAGDAWLVAGQTALGGWQAKPWPDDFVVAVVLEYLEKRSSMLMQVDGFLLMARDFFRKADALRLEDGANNRRLAAIATVHAVEMFLYGLFERREDLALSAFRENGTETLGPREALRALQTSLRRIGVLAELRQLSYRDQLSSLISHRDSIIHRAHEISPAELDFGMKNARRFIEKYGAELLNLDLLQ